MENCVLITGASSGIGKALAHQFAANGNTLVLVSQHEDKLIEAAVEIQRRHVATAVIVLAKDIAVESSAQEIHDYLRDRKLEVDVLVNNAAVGQKGEFWSIPITMDVAALQLNIEALVRFTKMFLPGMRSRNRGRIVNLGCAAGFRPGPFLSVYLATKAFVASFSEALAEELKDTRICVTCVSPGATATNFFTPELTQPLKTGEDSRLISPESVAQIAYRAICDGLRVVSPGTV